MEKKKTISIIDKEYVQWVKSLVERYRQSQIKAAVRFYLLYSHYTGIYPQLGGKLDKITNFLIELGTGFAYVGKEYRLQIGDTEKFNKLESTSQPIGISEYELERFYPAKIEGTIPTIEEIESKLNNNPV